MARYYFMSYIIQLSRVPLSQLDISRCWFPTWGISQVKSETGLCTWRQRETKERGRSVSLTGGSFSKEENLNTRLFLNGRKKNRSLLPPARILRVCMTALTGFRHIFTLHGLNTLLSQGYAIEIAPSVGMVVEHTFQGQGRG